MILSAVQKPETSLAYDGEMEMRQVLRLECAPRVHSGEPRAAFVARLAGEFYTSLDAADNALREVGK